MASWRSAVVHPLGLAGYALACVFALFARFGPTDQYPWLMPVAVAMAVIALMGGLLIAALQKPAAKRKSSKAGDGLPLSMGEQSTTGDQSPAVVSLKGPVSISYGGKAPENLKA
jgi:hypothetical protein